MSNQFACEACSKMIWKGWFQPVKNSLVMCGLCSNPQRFEAPDPRTENHDPGDEDRSANP